MRKNPDYFKIKYATYKLVKLSSQRGNQINGKMMPVFKRNFYLKKFANGKKLFRFFNLRY